MNKHDFYLLQGIFEHDPEAKDYNVLIDDYSILDESPGIRKMNT